jgi:hypothetical protein
MSKFLTGEGLSKKVYDIIWDAETTLFIVSPFIKLDDYFKTLFEKHKYNHKLHIVIVFGRNESRPSKSLGKEDFDFFKEFKNITIIYCRPLHAKYYANDSDGLITSINLYDKCFETNIEYGVHFQRNLLNSFVSNAESEAFAYTDGLLNNYPVVFVRRPVYEKKLLGKNYIESTTLYDATEKILRQYQWEKEKKRFYNEFDEEINANEFRERPEREFKKERPDPVKRILPEERQEKGYCIRTGVPIRFNVKKPMCYEAYIDWNQHKNQDFQEKYCHKTGALSYGRTSMRKPILHQ